MQETGLSRASDWSGTSACQWGTPSRCRGSRQPRQGYPLGGPGRGPTVRYMGKQSLSRMLAQPSSAGGGTNGPARPRAVFRFLWQYSCNPLERVAVAPSACSRPEGFSRPARPTRTAPVAIQWCDVQPRRTSAGAVPWRDRRRQSPGETGDIRERSCSKHTVSEKPAAGLDAGLQRSGAAARDGFTHQRRHNVLPELAARPSAEDRCIERHSLRAPARPR